MELAERLRSDDVTEEAVLAYLLHRSNQIIESGGVAIPLSSYWHHGDLERYRAAAAVWAQDAPPRFALPDLPTMLNTIAGPAGMPQTSFIEDLGSLWNQYADWMAPEGRDPYNGNETPAARRARTARESMARTRARRAGTNPLLEQSKAAHDAYLAACRARKDALAELDRNVREAWAAYEAARDAAKV
jgi:hypothetical protein